MDDIDSLPRRQTQVSPVASTRDEVLGALRRDMDAIRSFGATSVFLYGSAARDELRHDSDIDLFIDFDPEGPFSFVELIRLEEHVKSLLHREVDLTTRNGLHPLLRADIEHTSVRVF